MSNTIRLAVMGDAHYCSEIPSELTSARDDYYRALFREFFALDADVHILLGDVTHWGNPREWDFVLRTTSELSKRYDRQFRFILGNHDTLRQSREDVLEQTESPRYAVDEFPNLRIVYLDTTKESSHDNWGGLVDQEQLDWLDEMSARENRYTIVCGHHPIAQTTAGSDRDMMSIDNSREVLDKLANLSQEGLYLNGHNHVHSAVTGIDTLPGWTFVQHSAVLSAPVFRRYTVSDEAVHVSSYHADHDLLRQSELFRGLMMGYDHTDKAYGTAEMVLTTVPRSKVPTRSKVDNVTDK
jgi:Icc protein